MGRRIAWPAMGPIHSCSTHAPDVGDRDLSLSAVVETMQNRMGQSPQQLRKETIAIPGHAGRKAVEQQRIHGPEDIGTTPSQTGACCEFLYLLSIPRAEGQATSEPPLNSTLQTKHVAAADSCQSHKVPVTADCHHACNPATCPSLTNAIHACYPAASDPSLAYASHACYQ